jgi:hypothetical protein
VHTKVVEALDVNKFSKIPNFSAAHNRDKQVGMANESLEDASHFRGHSNVAGAAPQVHQGPVKIQKDGPAMSASQPGANFGPRARRGNRKTARNSRLWFCIGFRDWTSRSRGAR